MKAKRLSLDKISTLPPAIIETILCLVPIKDAVRTSILSKDWRYKWTKIPKLEFHEKYKYRVSTDENGSEHLMASERKMMGARCKVFYAIYQVLLMHQGPITEFILRMGVDKTCVEIDHIISHLSRNKAVKTFKLDLNDEEWDEEWDEQYNSNYRIPLAIISLQQLTDLSLLGCDFNLKPTFGGFGRLTSLYLKKVNISSKTLLHLVSNCPLLKTLTLLLQEYRHIICDDKNTIIELFECLPMIEHLTTWGWITTCFALGSVREEPPISLIHLKYLSLEYTFDDVCFLALLIRCSPNLEKITIQMVKRHFCDEINSVLLKAYSKNRLEHLNELKIFGFGNLKPDLEFVKFILAKSPKLKKVMLWLQYMVDQKEVPKMLRNLLSSSTASPVGEIVVRIIGNRSFYTTTPFH